MKVMKTTIPIEALHVKLDNLEARLVRRLAGSSITILRVGLGCVFLGFGALKFFPDVSPIESLVERTVGALTFGMLPGSVGLFLIAALECAIGVGLVTGKYLRLTLVLLGFQMIGAMSPLLLFSGELFSGPYHAPNLEGQYVIKDVVLISAGLVIGATLRGARMVSERVRRSEDYRRYQKKG